MDEDKKFKGYYIGTGYMGWVPWYSIYILFATEKEYYEYVEDSAFKEDK